VRLAPIGADGTWRACVERCDCQRQADADAAYQRAWAASNLTLDVCEAQTFATFDPTQQPEAYKALRAFAQAPAEAQGGPYGWVVLSGAPGCGKSHLLVAAAVELLARGRRPLYAIAPELLRYVRSGIASGQMDTRIDQARDADVLLLDDLGAEKNTEWSDELFYRVLNERYRLKRPTVIASNLLPTEMPMRLASRMRDVALSRVVVMRGADYRLTLGKRRKVGT